MPFAFALLLSLVVFVFGLEELGGEDHRQRDGQDCGNEFVQIMDGKLMSCGQVWRFAGANMHWLALDETLGGVEYPSSFRVEDGLETAMRMGATVVRSHSLGLSTGSRLSRKPDLDEINEQSVEKTDFAIYQAKLHGLRVIIPLTDEMETIRGSRRHFTEWKGVDAEQFYRDQGVIEDFLKAVEELVHHVNPYTKLALKDDPTILGWESGNRISAPLSWTERIGKKLKEWCPNQLVIDGSFGNGFVDDDVDGANDEKALALSSVDMYIRNYPTTAQTAENITRDSILAKEHGKILIVGSVDWKGDVGDFISILNSIQHGGDQVNSVAWSLLPHNDYFGYVEEDADDTSGEFPIHFPGDSVKMTNAVHQFLLHDYRMHNGGNTSLNMLIPRIPQITKLGLECELGETEEISAASLSVQWRGSAMSVSYWIEMSGDDNNSEGSPWMVICGGCANDRSVPVIIPYHQTLAGVKWVRIRGIGMNNEFGEYSDAEGIDLDAAARHCVMRSPAMSARKSNHLAASMVAVASFFVTFSVIFALIWFLFIRQDTNNPGEDGDESSIPLSAIKRKSIHGVKRKDSDDIEEDDDDEDGLFGLDDLEADGSRHILNSTL